MQPKTFCVVSLFAAALTVAGQTATTTNTVRPVSLQECIQRALAGNRDLQIQRFNPDIARMTLKGSYGYYDPVLAADVRHTAVTDSGGYSPKSLKRDAVYDAENYLANAGITGELPIGMHYEIAGNYANTWGVANSNPVESFSAGAAISVQQNLLKNFWTDSARTTIEVNKRQLKITELGVDYLAMDIINRATRAYYDLIYAHEFVKVEEKLLQVQKRFYEENKRKVEVGTLAPLEEKLALSQVARVQADLITSRNTVALAENNLKTLLGDDFLSSVGTTLTPADALVVVPERFDVHSSWQYGVSHRADLSQLRLDIEKAELDLKYRYNQLFPSLAVVAGYGLKGNDQYSVSSSFLAPSQLDPSAAGAFGQIRSRSDPNDLLGVIFSVPLSRTTERANYKASKVRKEQAQVLVKQREELVLREIDDAIKSAITYLEKVSATREAVEYAKAALDAEEKKLAAGKSTAYVVLQLQSDLATAAVAEIRAKADYNIAVSQLNFVEGRTLERNRIQVEIK
jgi:outer membrane protein